MRALTISRQPSSAPLTEIFAERIKEDRSFITTCEDYACRLDPADTARMLEQIMADVQQRLRPLTPWSLASQYSPHIRLRWDSPRASDRLELAGFSCSFGAGVLITLRVGFEPSDTELKDLGYDFNQRLSMRTGLNQDICTWRINRIRPRDCVFGKRKANPGDLEIFRNNHRVTYDRNDPMIDLDYSDPSLNGIPRHGVYGDPYYTSRPLTARGNFTDDIVTVTQDYLNVVHAAA